MRIVFILIVLALACIAMVAMAQNKRSSLPASVVKKLKKHRDQLHTITDDKQRVLEADKLMDELMYALGYTGSFADKLKKAGPRFSNEQELWHAHKMRNKIAHEIGYSPSAAEAKRAVNAFKKPLDAFLS